MADKSSGVVRQTANKDILLPIGHRSTLTDDATYCEARRPQ
jgi:hypothetical protein